MLAADAEFWEWIVACAPLGGLATASTSNTKTVQIEASRLIEAADIQSGRSARWPHLIPHIYGDAREVSILNGPRAERAVPPNEGCSIPATLGRAHDQRQRRHQPRGLTEPDTSAQDLGGMNTRQLAQVCLPTGESL